MENLRWILILAGVAILVMLYFSGRPKKTAERRGHGPDNDFGDIDDRYDPDDDFDPLLGDQPLHDQYGQFDDVHPDDLARPGEFNPDMTRPGAGASGGPRSTIGHPSAGYADAGHPNTSLPEMGRPSAQYPGSSRSTSSNPNAVHQPYDYDFDDIDQDLGKAGGMGAAAASGFSSFTQKFEAFSERLSPKRRQRIAESEPADLDEDTAADPEYTNKIVTLHVVAPPNSLLSGEHLLAVFEQRGYHFGDMNIFHSMHDGTTVFSVAKMIEPGFFDINDLSSFDTPGITLILQLPGPVPADVSFEVLVSEAFEMANELGATVLDEHHSNLSKQTVQHLREGIYEYMHRQKYFGTVPS